MSGRVAWPAALLLFGLGATDARAQSFTSSTFFGSGLGSGTLNGASPYGNLIQDDRTYLHAMLNQFEGRFGGGGYVRWDGEGWIGSDDNRLWIKSEGRVNPDGHGSVTDGDQELLYDRPFSRYFDWQAGARYDLDDGTGRLWGALGVEGLAIGFWTVSATLYASDSSHYAARVEGSYDLYLTQRIVLQPQFEANWYSAEDRGRELGGGLSDLDTGLRLRYDITRKLSPYVGVTYQRMFDGTEALVREQDGRINDVRFVCGVRSWF